MWSNPRRAQAGYVDSHDRARHRGRRALYPGQHISDEHRAADGPTGAASHHRWRAGVDQRRIVAAGDSHHLHEHRDPAAQARRSRMVRRVRAPALAIASRLQDEALSADRRGRAMVVHRRVHHRRIPAAPPLRFTREHQGRHGSSGVHSRRHPHDDRLSDVRSATALGHGAMTDVKRTESGKRRTRWPGWIWSVPIAAVALVVWLLLRALSTNGIKVTVVFDNAEGLKANGSDVTYRGVQVGEVTGVDLTDDQRHVNVSLSIDREMKRALNAGTRFYLEGAHPSLSNLSSLKSVLS